MPTTFTQLRNILSTFEQGMVVKKDEPDYYYLNTNVQVKAKDLFFGAVQIRKSYVAYHLYPVYLHPELLDAIPDSLRKRMQGKSCFNFKKDITDVQAHALLELTRACYQQFVANGYVEIA